MALIAKGLSLLLMRCLAPLLGVVLAAWVLLLLLRHCRSVSGKGIPPAQWVALSVVMVVCTLFSGKNTNGVQNVGGGNLFLFDPPPVQSVTPQDISNGWRVAEEMEAEAFAPSLSFAVTNELWRLRGAHDDSLRIPAEGWSYPFATGVTVLSRGELRTCMRAHDFPRAFEQDLSLLPLASWPQLPEGRRESLFWHGATPSNTLLATWRNAALGRDATNPVSFQAELFPDGGFTYRYEDRTVRHARVWQFDWDDDGLENSLDPDPLLAGPDAHGTNAEWYNAVCSNVLVAAEGPDGVSLSWREGVNSNAYYWVEVAAERGPAAISFAGDRESALGDPVVVTRGGETNRIPLLIGIRYAVTSDVPFAVAFTDSGFATISTNGPRSAEVIWPLEFAFTEGFADGSRVYAVDVVPYDPGGVFSWEMRGGAPQGGMRGGGCSCVSYSGRSIVFGCTSTCECGGTCAGSGAYMLESAIFAATGGVCRCGFDDPPPPEAPSTHNATDGPSLFISFSKSAVIFEDEYVDSENGAVPRRSTRVRLTVSAYGGTRGGSLVLGAQNLGKLVAVAEGPINLPPVLTLAAQQSFYTTCVYEGGEASGEADDISVAGYFMETGTGERIDDSDTLTALRIELAPWATAPLNTNPHRHVLGIGENVNCLQYPSNPSIALQAASNWTITTLIGYAYFTCPLTSARDGITIIFRGQTYKPLISILEPTGILAVNAAPTRHGVPRGEAGGVGMELDLYVLPRTVSFSNIAMEEIECFTGTHTGYFANIEFEGEWSHTEECGAGDWHDIGQDNFFFRDNPKFKRSLPRMMEDGTITTNKAYGWKSGTLVWDIPIGWGYHGTTDDMGLEGCLDGYQQVFEIFPDGLSGVQKFSNHVMRSTNDVIHLNGVEVP